MMLSRLCLVLGFSCLFLATHTPAKMTELISRADTSKLRLAIENAHENDARIKFYEERDIEIDGETVHESHVYYVDGKKMGLSVTGLLGMVDSDPFDSVKVSSRIAAMSKPHARYSYLDSYGDRVKMSAKAIRNKWQEANELGTDLHGKIELYLNSVPVPLKDGDPNVYEFAQFIKWWEVQKAKGYEAYRTEMLVFDTEADLSGSIDFIMRHKKTGKFVIIDWKRCITEGSGFSSAFGGKRMSRPLDHIAQHKLNKWKLQVNVYREILEHNYGMEIEKMAMVVCHEDNDEAQVYWHPRTMASRILLNHRLVQVGGKPRPLDEEVEEESEPSSKRKTGPRSEGNSGFRRCTKNDLVAMCFGPPLGEESPDEA